MQFRTVQSLYKMFVAVQINNSEMRHEVSNSSVSLQDVHSSTD